MNQIMNTRYPFTWMFLTLSTVFFSLLFITKNVDACTRVLFTGDESTVITGRSMDWEEDMNSDLWVLPRGMKRNGLAGKNSISWTSKFGSVVTSSYDIASSDGMNEKGLVMNLLYLAESQYKKKNGNGNSPAISVTLWGQYALDNFATVKEAVKAMQTKLFYIVSPKIPNGRESTLHLSLSDSSGDSAIFEYIDGNLVVHHDKNYKVMTNSPIYDKQLALNEYWEGVDGKVFMPGTARASDRFARASFYLKNIPTNIDQNYIKGLPKTKQNFKNQAIAEVMSIMRSVSVPLGVSSKPALPNISTTIWRTVADQSRLIYYFDSATRPSVFWVSLEKVDFEKGATIKRLHMTDDNIFAGDVSEQFKVTEPFKFLGM